MKPVQSSAGVIFGINIKFLGAALMGFTAYAIWPTSYKWWGFGLLSIMLGAAALGSLIGAFREIIQLYLRDRAIEKFMAQGAAPKSSELASSDALKKAGMVD